MRGVWHVAIIWAVSAYAKFVLIRHTIGKYYTDIYIYNRVAKTTFFQNQASVVIYWYFVYEMLKNKIAKVFKNYTQTT